MTIIYEVLTVALIYIASGLLGRVVPVPSSLLGLALFFILLLTGLLKAEKYSIISPLILANLAFFFIPPAVSILDSLDILSGNVIRLAAVIVLSNILVMAVTGKVVQALMKKERSDD